MTDIDSLEGVLLDTNKEIPIRFVHSEQDRLIAARELEGKGLRALGVIGSYWTAVNFVDETCPEIPKVMQEVWNRERKKYEHLSQEGLIYEIAKEVLGYAPKDDEVIPEKKYDKVYGTVHSIIAPHMIMGRMDCGFGRVKACTMNGLLEGYRSMLEMSRRAR